MLYSELAETFDRLESTSSRLEMTDILADFFRKADRHELRSIVYLSQGKLHPDFVPGVLGMADRLVLKAIAFTSGTSEDKAEKLWIETGDPGKVAETLISGKKQMTLFSEELSVARVVKGLTAIQDADGKDSQDKKMKTLANMLHDSGPLEARYLCRTVTGRMRVGAADMTILDALAIAFSEKEDRPAIERAFNVTCDIGLVAETIANGGMDAIRRIGVSVDSPVKVMLAERLPSVSQIVERMGGRCAIEYKYDGIRVQAHIGKDHVRLYSRRLEDLTSNFPDIAQELRSACRYGEAIIEGECVAIDPDTGNMLPFQNVTHRRKKHGMDEAVKEIPVRIFMFDCLYRDGEDMTPKPYLERRGALESGFEIGGPIQMTTMRIVENEEEGEEFFASAVASRCEGIMAKSVSEDSVYRAGSRGFLWIKYKKDYQQALTDSFDLTVVGGTARCSWPPTTRRRGCSRPSASWGPDSTMRSWTGCPRFSTGRCRRRSRSRWTPRWSPMSGSTPRSCWRLSRPRSRSARYTPPPGMLSRKAPGSGSDSPGSPAAEQCTTVGEIVEMYSMQAHDSDGLSEE